MSKQTQVSKPIPKGQGPTSITGQTSANPKTAHRKGPSTSSIPKSSPKNPTPTTPKITVVKDDATAQNPNPRTLSNPPKMSIEEARRRLEEEQRKLQKEREEFEREKKRFEEEKARLNRQKLQSQGMK
jgi:molecular chaperone GrpE (heat shock protein)